MKRRAAMLAVFLALGAVVNVAVAWAVAVWPLEHSYKWMDYTSTGEPLRWRMQGESTLTFERLMWRAGPAQLIRGLGEYIYSPYGPLPQVTAAPPSWSRIRWQELPIDDDLNFIFVEDARGWPVLSMASYTSSKLSDRPHYTATSSSGIWLDPFPSRDGWGERVLPLRPIWPGFLFNTLFYAAILWLLFAGPFALRRALRRRRGQCERCAYPIGVSPVCTECGAAVVLTRTA